MTRQPQTKSYVVASSRPWNRGLGERLTARTGHRFVQATSAVELDSALAQVPDARYLFFPHWSSRIPARVWQRFETVIFHMTDLPYGRGGSPLQNLIVRGHTGTMISALQCVEQVDAGSVYLRAPLSLEGSAEEILLRADAVIENMIVEMVNREPVAAPQVGTPTIFERRTPEASALPAELSLERVYDHIRMLDAQGYPPAYLDVGPLRFEFTRAGRRSDRVEASVVIRQREPGDRK